MFFINAAKPGPTDDFWYEPISSFGSVTKCMSPTSAMSISAVYACVKVLAESIAQLPRVIIKNTGVKKDRDSSHRLYNLIHSAPNEFQTAYEWAETLMMHLALYGNSYHFIIYSDDGFPEQLIPISNERVKVIRSKDYYAYEIEGYDKPFARFEILHFRGMSLDGVTGISPIKEQSATLNGAKATLDYSSRYFETDGQVPGWIEFPGRFKDQDQRTNFIQSWKKSQAGVNRRSVAVLESGMKYHDVAISNEDAQLIESRKYQVEDIARIFRVPPHKIGHLERSTNNNIEHQAIEFVQDTVLSWAIRVEQTLHRQILLDSPTHSVSLILDGMLRGDTKSRYESYSIGINTGFLTRNEVRSMENRNPLPGLDEPIQPLNMGNAGGRNDGKQGGQSKQSQKVIESAIEAAAKKESGLLSKISTDNVELHLSQLYPKHATYLSKILGMSGVEAFEYCSNRHDSVLALINKGDIKSALCQETIKSELSKCVF